MVYPGIVYYFYRYPMAFLTIRKQAIVQTFLNPCENSFQNTDE